MSTIHIDGSYLEGGGQILRNALSLSCILQKSLKITSIRANRPNPGLSAQHLTTLNLLQEVTNAKVSGNFMKSCEVEFHPGPIKSGDYKVNAQTAASCSLIIQGALPVLLFGSGPSTLEIAGGTNVGMAPQVDYMTEVFRPNLENFEASFDFDLIRRGYYPRGGGLCKVSVTPVKGCLRNVDITNFGSIQEICGWCYVAGRLPMKIANDMQQAAEKQLSPLGVKNLNIEAYKESPEVARDNGSGLVLKAVTSTNCILGSSALGERQVDGAGLGAKAGDELLQYIKQGVCVDIHTQDQLILFMALAHGFSKIKTLALTDHTKTAIYVAEQMTGVKFRIEELSSGHVLLSCSGIGFKTC